MSGCYLCPRACGIDRSRGQLGFCKEGSELRIARYSLHQWEEPVISGERGSGTVFFSGCDLRCEFCQNRAISHGDKGDIVSVERFCEIMLELRDMGAENINLVTPTHFADKIAVALKSVKDRLSLPVVYNSSGYESVQTLRMLEGLVDVYLPDFKYFSDESASKYSHAPDYRRHAEAALLEMFRQVGKPSFDDRGMMKKGIIVRHLILPTCRKESIEIVRRIAELFGTDGVLVSIMSQYTPDFAIEAKSEHRELHRRLTSFEYSSVLDEVQRLGLQGFSQCRSSATSKYTPDF